MPHGNALRHQFATHTARGAERGYNTDVCETFPLVGGFGFVLCDGVDGKGGEGGALAAKLAAEGVKRHFKNNPVRNKAKALQGAMMLANFMVYDHAKKNPRFDGMGARVLVAIVVDDLVHYASAGTNSLVIQREGVMYQIVDGAQGKDDCLGNEKNARFSLCKNPVQSIAGDVLLAFSDGVNIGFSNEQIAELISQDDISPDVMAYQIIYKLEELGAKDNATVAIARLSGGDDLPPAGTLAVVEKPSGGSATVDPRRRKLMAAIIGAVAIGLIALGFAFARLLFGVDYIPEEPLVQRREATAAHKKADTKPAKTEIDAPKPAAPSETAPAAPKTAPAAPAGRHMHEYTVGQGDTFYKLGLLFNITVDELTKLNPREANNLRLGQKIKIPVAALHTVKAGETLDRIAQTYKVPQNDIARANKISNDRQLRVGSTLVIPLPRP